MKMRKTRNLRLDLRSVTDRFFLHGMTTQIKRNREVNSIAQQVLFSNNELLFLLQGAAVQWSAPWHQSKEVSAG